MNLLNSNTDFNYNEQEKIIDHNQDDLESLNNFDEMFHPRPLIFNDHVFPTNENNTDTFGKKLLSDCDLSLTYPYSPFSKISESDSLSESDYLGQNFMKSSFNELSGTNFFEQLNPTNELNDANGNNIKQRIFKDENPIINKKETENCENIFTNQNSFTLLKKNNEIEKKPKFFVYDNKQLSMNDGKSFSFSFAKTVTKKRQRYFDTDCSNIKISKDGSKKFKYKCEHPGCTQTFKTKKLKLNRHDLSNPECKVDFITLLHLVKKTGDILGLKEKKSKNFRIKKLKKLFKKSFVGLPHYEYAINILGSKS